MYIQPYGEGGGGGEVVRSGAGGRGVGALWVGWIYLYFVRWIVNICIKVINIPMCELLYNLRASFQQCYWESVVCESYGDVISAPMPRRIKRISL